MEDIKTYSKVEDEVQYIEFSLGDRKLCLAIDDVEEIVKPSKVESVPLAHPFIQGVTALRGDVLPVINLNKVLGLADDYNQERRFIVIRSSMGKVALSVNQVDQIFSASSIDTLEEVQPFVSTLVKRGEETVYLLDVRQLFEELEKESDH